jgi:hypothetical protein
MRRAIDQRFLKTCEIKPMPHSVAAKLLLLPTLLWVQSAVADNKTIYPLVTYSCDPGSDIVKITNSLLKDGTGETYNYSDAEGTYSPWNLVEIDHTPDRSRIVKTHKLIKKCTLSSGEYTFIIEPQLFGRDLNGRCGASISTALTVTHDGIDILERTPFENFCHGNAPVIIRVTTFGRTGEVKIKRIPKYKFY